MKNFATSNRKEVARPDEQNLRRQCLKLLACLLAIFPASALCSVESSLQAVQSKLVGTFLPLAAICGLTFAGLSFVMGRPNARQHFFYAVLGAIIGFGAESIIALVRSLVN